MSRQFLQEHADAARIALTLAEREANHLQYTVDTLFGCPAFGPVCNEIAP